MSQKREWDELLTVSAATDSAQFRSGLKAAFQDSARPEAPAPPGWWVLPVLGIVGSLFLLKVNFALGIVCFALACSFFGFCLHKARKNRL